MADQKISQLSELTNPNPNDVIPIVNGGSTKKITVANLAVAGSSGTSGINGTSGSSGTSGSNGTDGSSGTSPSGVATTTVNPDFIHVGRITSDQIGVGSGSDVIFNRTIVSSGITMNTSTGVFTLTANKTYRLFGSVGFVNFSSATGWFVYQWVDATTNTALDTTGISVGVAEALNRDVSEFNATSANLIYTPSTNQTIKLRITDGNGTVSIRSGIGTKATIEQINPTVTVNDGTNGSNGSSGTSGVNGTSGSSGTNGTNGSSGSNGSSGTSGSNGSSGTSGSNGSSGTSGSNGTSGSSGTTPIYSGSLQVTNQIQSTATGSQPSMVNTNPGSGIILSSVNGTSGTGSLRIVTNGGAWTDNRITTYLQVSGSLGNDVTVLGGTYGSDVPLDRIQFVSKQSQFTNAGFYNLTPPSTHTLEVINIGTGSQAVFGVIGASGQTANLMDVATTGSNNVISINNKGSLLVMGGDNNTGSIWIKGNNAKGGSQYNEFLKITNTSGSIANPHKHFRQNGVGDIDIINSAYDTTILNLTDSGNLSINGSLTMANRPAFRVVGAGGATAAITVLSGSMTTVDYNQGNAWNNSNGTFTAPIAGLYQVNLVVRCSGNSNPTAQVIVYKNYSGSGTGTTQIMVEWAANTTANHMGGSTISKLAVGDTLRAVVSVGSISFDSNDNFSVAYIG